MNEIAITISIVTGGIAILSAIFAVISYIRNYGVNGIQVRFLFRPPWSDGAVINYHPQKNYFSYLKRNQVVYAFPEFLVVVHNWVKGRKPVSMAPYLIVELIDVKPFPENCDFFMSWNKGGVGRLNIVKSVLMPGQKHFTTAPVVDVEQTVEEKPDLAKIPFFYLEPEESESFLLNIRMVPGYIYLVRIGVSLSLLGEKNFIRWDRHTYSFGIPTKSNLWINDTDDKPSPLEKLFIKFKLWKFIKRADFQRHYGPEKDGRSVLDPLSSGYSIELLDAQKFQAAAEQLARKNNIFALPHVLKDLQDQATTI